MFQIDSRTKVLGDFNKQIEVQFIVEDTGPGLSEEQQEHMFQLFGKAKFSDDKNQTGIGIGLTYCKQVIDKFQGNIICIS